MTVESSGPDEPVRGSDPGPQRRSSPSLSDQGEAHFQLLADAMPQLVWTTDRDGYHYYFNRRWYQYTGLTAAQSAGDGWRLAFHPDDLPEADRRWRHSLQSGEPYEIEYRCRRLDGSWRWFLGRALVVRDPEGQILKWIGTCTDIDDQKRAAQTLEKSAVLAALGATLSSSMSRPQMIGELCRLVTPALADWCAVDLVDDDGQIRRAGVHHRDPAATAFLGQHLGRVVINPDAAEGAAQVIRTGQTCWMARIPQALLAERARNDALREIVHQIGVASYIIVPLTARGRVIGAFTLVRTREEDAFDEGDVHIAEELARRTAQAIEAAMLHGELQKLATIIESSGDVIAMFSLDGKGLYINDAGARLTGVEPERGWSLEDMFLAGARPFLRRTILPTALQEGRWQGEISMRNAQTSTTMPVDFNLFVMRDGKNGEPVGLATVTRDVSDKKQNELRLREEAERLDTLNRVGKQLGAELDLKRLVQVVTDAATWLSGAHFGAFFYNVTSEAGESYMLYALSGVPPEAFSKFPMPRNTAIFAPTFTGAGVVRLDDVTQDPRYGQSAPHHGMPAGHLPVRSYLAVPVISRSGDVIGGIFLGHGDVGVFTERAEKLVVGLASQAAIAMDNAHLFGEAHRLIQALEKSNKDLDQFAYVTSHDLKAPLRGIANLSQWIEDDLADRLTDDTRENLNLLRGRVHRLESLIDGILSYSRAGRTRDKAERIDMGAFLEGLVELLAPRAGATVRILPGMPTLVTEKVPIEQVFMNLINNALKHNTRPDPEVEVGVVDAGARWEFFVRDNGPGIAPRYHERIWAIFQTLQARDKVEGTGIGLAVIRKIVEARGGRAWVESEEGQGATFRFTWPKSEPTPEDRPSFVR